MKRIFALFVCLTISVVSFAQDKPASIAAVSEIPPGPSMKETEVWIKRELRDMGSDHIVTKYKDTTRGTKYEIESAVLSECRLTIRTSEQDDASFGVTFKRRTHIATVTLKDVDVEKLQSKEISVVPGATMSKPSYRIIVAALSERGAPFLLESDGYAGGKTTKSVRVVGVRVREQSMSNHAVEVFRRAAILCGAPNQPAALSVDELAKVFGRYNRKEKSTDYIDLNPDGTFFIKADGESLSGNYKVQGDTLILTSPAMKEQIKTRIIGNTLRNDKGIVNWEKQAEPQKTAESEIQLETQSQTSKPASPVASKMTNDDVIQLVTAGLSEKIIITSIRQASAKDFDLSPTGLIALKKAGVPDAVIVVMQEKGLPVQTPSTSETKTPPKYDATLAQPEKLPADNGCSGIELMGLYKDDWRPVAPLILWFAKVRNGTSLARIVTVSWTNLYGEDKSFQAQVKSGDIATLELTRQQPIERQPINLRLSSCR